MEELKKINGVEWKVLWGKIGRYGKGNKKKREMLNSSEEEKEKKEGQKKNMKERKECDKREVKLENGKKKTKKGKNEVIIEWMKGRMYEWKVEKKGRSKRNSSKIISCKQ